MNTTTTQTPKTSPEQLAINNQKQRIKNRAHTPPTQAWCKEHYTYNPETGALTRNARMGRYPAGGQVGKLNGKGFRVMKVDGRVYTMSRIIWLMVTGNLPTRTVNFRDGDRTNMRANNLSLAHRPSRSELWVNGRITKQPKVTE